jgi:hypothetical protein
MTEEAPWKNKIALCKATYSELAIALLPIVGVMVCSMSPTKTPFFSSDQQLANF